MVSIMISIMVSIMVSIMSHLSHPVSTTIECERIAGGILLTNSGQIRYIEPGGGDMTFCLLMNLKASSTIMQFGTCLQMKMIIPGSNLGISDSQVNSIILWSYPPQCWVVVPTLLHLERLHQDLQ